MPDTVEFVLQSIKFKSRDHVILVVVVAVSMSVSVSVHTQMGKGTNAKMTMGKIDTNGDGKPLPPPLLLPLPPPSSLHCHVRFPTVPSTRALIPPCLKYGGGGPHSRDEQFHPALAKL